ncbi:MAG: N-acetylneuraminate synthase [Candidatus Omnitrophica bacterium CG11_big_fil_rev_8_21_14_0_20_45_26]|uniref:N-acetylneuraminate synthase n=1 Tax=Candidatus Abzuiibacterium crystallinum TaxID=1974748 RepID=A0A2H0LLF6_9BACT|nr:MAG: N-acetylneuraminate synthase [Candidatus Omnitrophica bacterium CG11_big_fil_rev_8_21_14_0_20_45_26]PIW64477.1 MAG: N-acetylneuraminate synthase [Candidatus Omnitrophica bacterium CG12_big_fil_rev_8_21_14_0_65_45_16]
MKNQNEFLNCLARSVYVIAEIGINHCGDLEKAKYLIREAKACGANAAKFQTFKTELLIRQDQPKMPYQHQNTQPSENQFQMLKKVELSEASHRLLQKYALEVGIDFISTPYDPMSADLLIKLGLPVLKVASTDTTNIPFLRYLNQLPAFLIISTGVTEMEELRQSMQAIGVPGNGRIALLHCISNYPAPLEEANLKCIQSLRQAYECPVGFSDHTDEIEMGAYAVVAGARIIEKHFTFNKSADGPDHQASFTPPELQNYIGQIRRAEKCLGDGLKRVMASEKAVKVHMQKSLVAKENLEAGAVLSADNLWTMRPATGISPLAVDQIIGKRINKAKNKFEMIYQEDLDG